MTDRADLVVIGAGTLGGWASVFARAAGLGRVVVVERATAGMGASSRAAGIVRAQGGTAATVALGRWSIDFYRGLGARPVEEWINYRLEGEALAALAADA